MERLDDCNFVGKLRNELFVTDDSNIIVRKYKQYKVIAIAYRTELLDAIEKVWEHMWVSKHDVVKFMIFRSGMSISSFNRGNGSVYRTVMVNSTVISNPSGKNVVFFVKTCILKKALDLITDDKVIIRVGSDYIAIKSHNLYEKSIAIIKQMPLLCCD
ncbi:MAG: hypothetical protein JHC31_12375 [Sulfurihydrogenibium sp.]|jgi:hypothetical protein|nr:hypothetical protein [Sulfurihydrogenibium sp.]